MRSGCDLWTHDTKRLAVAGIEPLVVNRDFIIRRSISGHDWRRFEGPGPRDTAAVLGVIALVFGSGPVDRFLPVGVPSLVRDVLIGVWWSIPTSFSLGAQFASPSSPRYLLILLAQLAFGLLGIWLLLGTSRLLQRSRDDA
jgi:hypothetical protein